MLGLGHSNGEQLSVALGAQGLCAVPQVEPGPTRLIGEAPKGALGKTKSPGSALWLF